MNHFAHLTINASVTFLHAIDTKESREVKMPIKHTVYEYCRLCGQKQCTDDGTWIHYGHKCTASMPGPQDPPRRILLSKVHYVKGQVGMISEARCDKCGGTNIYWREEHPDTGMDEMVMVCRDCKPKVKPLPLSFKIRENISIWWSRHLGRYVVRNLFRLARWSAKRTNGYCTWCGAQPGFSSSVSRKGLRCMSLNRDCSKY